MKRSSLCILVVAICALGLAACGGGQTIGVAITTAPTSLAVGASGNVAAAVSHDPTASGVRWTCVPVTACGAITVNFDPDSTPSGSTSVFTAPPAIPAGGQITIIATSVANPSPRKPDTCVAVARFLRLCCGVTRELSAGEACNQASFCLVRLCPRGTHVIADM